MFEFCSNKMLEKEEVEILFFTNPHYSKMFYSIRGVHELDGWKPIPKVVQSVHHAMLDKSRCIFGHSVCKLLPPASAAVRYRVCLSAYLSMSVCVHRSVYVCVYVCLSMIGRSAVCLSVCVCLFVSMCVCICDLSIFVCLCLSNHLRLSVC